MKTAGYGLAAALFLLVPFALMPGRWHAGFYPLCLKESLFIGFGLIGYAWLWSRLAMRFWPGLSGERRLRRTGRAMALGVALAVLYVLAVTQWDWDVRYLWSACVYLK